jgi:hypothetical protein
MKAFNVFDQHACLRQRQAMINRGDDHFSRIFFVDDVDTV